MSSIPFLPYKTHLLIPLNQLDYRTIAGRFTPQAAIELKKLVSQEMISLL